MFYLIFIPASAMLILMAIYLRKLTKHDKVLFRLCQIRRDIMSIFRKEGFSLPKSDYNALKQLLKVLNTTIHNYEQMKTSHFNWSGLASLMRELKDSVDKVEKVEMPENPRIEKLKSRLARTFIMAFLTYTPFIKPVVCLSLLIWLLTQMTKLGMSKLQKALDYLNYIFELRNRYENSNRFQPSA